MKPFSLGEHRGTSIVYFHKTKHLIIGTRDGKILDLNPLQSFIEFPSDLNSVACLAICENNFIWAGGSNGIRKFNESLESFECIDRYNYSDEAIIGLAVYNGSIFSASEDSSVRVSNKRESRTLYSHEGAIIAFDFSAKSEMIVTSCSDSTLILYTIKNNTSRKIDLNEKIWCLKFMNNEKMLLAGDHSGGISKFKLPELIEYSLFRVYHESRVKSITLLENDEYIATCSFDQTVKIIDVKKEFVLQNYTEHNGWVRAVTFDSDSNRVYSIGDDNLVGVIEAKTNKDSVIPFKYKCGFIVHILFILLSIFYYQWFNLEAELADNSGS